MDSSTIGKTRSVRTTGLVFLILLFCLSASAHVIQGELDKLPPGAAAVLYLQLGFLHIVPFGIDHILFVLSLFLLSPKLKPLLWQATAFTVAHSITLGLAMYHVITPPTVVVEPLIAVSILYVALENIFSPRLKASRIGVVFLFGLVHGLGFAGALGQLGLPRTHYLLALVMFNLGVELGQVTVILVAWFLLARWFAGKSWYRKRVVVPLSVFIAIIAAFWTVGRVLASIG
jgi:HupE / UreJ protein